MSGTTDHSESAGVIRSDPRHPDPSRHPDPDTEIVSESRSDGGVARDPRDTLIMKQNIDAYFRSSRKRA